MRKNNWNRNFAPLTWFLLGLFLPSAAGWAASVDSARWMPEDTMVYVQVENVNALRDKFKESSLHGLYKDPAMQVFIVPAEEKIRQKIDELLKKAWQEINLQDPPDELPWPQGKIVMGVFFQTRTKMMPDYSKMNRENFTTPFDPESLPKVETQQPDFQVVGLADMGEKIQSLQDLARDMTSKAVEEGIIRQRETVRGVEINIIKKKQEQDENYDSFCYGFKDNWLIAGSSLKYIREVLIRMEDSDRPSLADRRDLTEVAQTLGDEDLFVYVNAQTIKNVTLNSAPEQEKEKLSGIIKTLGFENVDGLGATIQMASSRREEMKMKVLLSVKGEKAGIPALLTPATTSNRPNRLLSKGMASFVVMNYDLARIYNGIVYLAWHLSQVNIDGTIQMALASTGQPGEGGREPVNFKKELMGQLTNPVTITTRYDKPYTNADSAKSLLAFAVRDGEVLDTALARIHNVFIAQGKEEMRRELNNCTIYLMPPIPAMLIGMMASTPDDPQGQIHLALAVVGDQLIFSTEKVVEQAIRDLGREDMAGINTDPMYQYASRYMPAQAGAFYYENGQISAEVLWATLKEAAKQAAQNSGSGSPAGDENEITLGVGFGSGGISPMAGIIEEFKEFVDFTTLPDFELVKKYFGVTVGHVVGNDKGIYAEIVELKAPSSSD